MNIRTFSTALLLLSAAAHAGELSPEEVAKIQAEEQEAQKKVQAAHGNRSAAEMDSAERKQMMEEQRKASQEVLQKNGVSAKDYARASATMSREERDRAKAAKDALEAEASKKSAAKDTPSTGPTIEYGIPKDEAGGGAKEAREPKQQSSNRSKSSGSHGSGKSKHHRRGY